MDRARCRDIEICLEHFQRPVTLQSAAHGAAAGAAGLAAHGGESATAAARPPCLRRHGQL
jgi:hypothetical protein